MHPTLGPSDDPSVRQKANVAFDHDVEHEGLGALVGPESQEALWRLDERRVVGPEALIVPARHLHEADQNHFARLVEQAEERLLDRSPLRWGQTPPASLCGLRHHQGLKRVHAVRLMATIYDVCHIYA